MKKKNFTKTANILFNSRINKQRLDKLPHDCRPENINEAYDIQNKLKQKYLSLKENYLIGKKVGCTNLKAQEQIGINEPFYGNLFSKYSSLDNCNIFSKNFSEPYMEPEIAFKIKKDIDISKSPFTFDKIENYIESIVCSVEIVDFRFTMNLKEIGIENLISSNAASEYWIRNEKEFHVDEIDLNDHPIKVFINEKNVENGNTSNVLGNPKNSLLWLINKLTNEGETLLKNNFVSTGTCTKAIPLKKKSIIRVDFGKIGNIKFQYI